MTGWALPDGTEVTIRALGGTERGLVITGAAVYGPKCARGDHSDCENLWGAPQHAMLGFIDEETEGVSWCRGWEGPAVEALRVSVALERG